LDGQRLRTTDEQRLRTTDEQRFRTTSRLFCAIPEKLGRPSSAVSAFCAASRRNRSQCRGWGRTTPWRISLHRIIDRPSHRAQLFQGHPGGQNRLVKVRGVGALSFVATRKQPMRPMP